MNFSEFIVTNWQYIGTAILALLSIIIMIIKKRPKKLDELNDVISQAISKIPGFIIQAEDLDIKEGYSGADKKSMVLNWVFTFIENALHRQLTSTEEQYAFKAISYFVELVLEAPTKKGGYGREEVEE